MQNSANESSPSPPEDQSSEPTSHELPRRDDVASDSDLAMRDQPGRDMDPFVVVLPSEVRQSDRAVSDLRRQLSQIQLAEYHAYRRKQLRTSVILFLLTLLSTFLVGSNFLPLHYLASLMSPLYSQFLRRGSPPGVLEQFVLNEMINGLQYAVPLMMILFFHEMGHFLQSRWNRVPASLPYFIPMPIPPMGTMGAVIFQGRGAATRRQMFDIAVSGPIAGLILTLPILWYGLTKSSWKPIPSTPPVEFGEPLLLQWMISFLHGPQPIGEEFMLTPMAFAGWVGVLITAMNLLPVGQLDGGHILYTLIGKRAHTVAMLVIGAGLTAMIVTEKYSFILLLILLLITGPRHPPTSNDNEPLGLWRHIVGWLTLSFLIIGFTPQPIVIPDREDEHRNEQKQRARPGDQVVRIW